MDRQKNPRRLEKLISYILGRRPDEFGLVLDEYGFVRLKDLLKAVSEEPGWRYVRKSHIQGALMISREGSFVLENGKIKTICRDAAPNPEPGVVPPKLLYYCVRPRAYPVVCQQGIIPSGQPQVHLAASVELAQRMGKRRARAPVLLTVQARKAFEAGVRFSKQGELIYITERVPPGYFTGPPLPKEKKKEDHRPKKEPVAMPEDMPGSFTLDVERSRALQQQRSRRKVLKKGVTWKKDLRRLRRKRKREEVLWQDRSNN